MMWSAIASVIPDTDSMESRDALLMLRNVGNRDRRRRQRVGPIPGIPEISHSQRGHMDTRPNGPSRV